MYSNVTCPSCKHKYWLPEGEMGKRQTCPNCQTAFFAGKSVAEARVGAPSGPAPQQGFARTMLADSPPAIKYNCPRCKAPLEAPLSEAGAKINCPHCTQRVQVPNQPKPEPPVASPTLNKTMLASDESLAPPIKYNCPSCKKPLEAPASEAGKKMNCPACSQRLQIPNAPAGAPNRNKTMLATEESATGSQAVRVGSVSGSGSATPQPNGTVPTPNGMAGLQLTGRNVAIGIVILLLLLLVVPAVIRGGKATDADALAKSQLELEKLKAEIELKKAEMDRQKNAEMDTRRQIEEMMAKMRAQDEKMREEHRQLIRSIADQNKKAELEDEFKKAQRKLELDKLEMERKQQKLLEDTQAKLEESKRALEASQQKQQTIIHQPPPVVYYPPYHPRYYWGW